MPPSGDGAVLRSYSKHVGRNRLKPLDEDVLDQSVDVIADLRGDLSIKFPTGDRITYSQLRRLCEESAIRIAGDKSPGFPLNISYHDNRSAFLAEYDNIIDAACARLLLWLDDECQRDIMTMDTWSLVLNAIHDPSSIFVKNEPHPKRKVIEERYRCITPISLVDQIVEGCLFNPCAARLKESLYENGSAVGIGFSDDQAKIFQVFLDRTQAKHGPPTTYDQSGADALHTPQTYEASCIVDDRVHGKGLPEWCGANRVYSKVACEGASVISGVLYRKARPGCLSSGSKDTSRRNTIVFPLLGTYFSIKSGQPAKHSNANGDDTILWGVRDLNSFRKEATEAGCKLRELRNSNTSVEFCSHTFSSGRFVLNSWPKSVYRLLVNRGVRYEDAMQFAFECRHDEKIYPLLLEFIRRSGFPSAFNSSESTKECSEVLVMTRNKRSRRARGNGAGVAHLTTEICAVTDPFCPHAEGAVSPYGSKLLTIPYTLKGFQQFSTGAGGSIGIIFRASQSSAVANSSNGTANVFQSLTYGTSGGSHPSFISQNRLVSCGIRWHCVVPATSGGGTIAVVPVQDDGDVMDNAQHAFADLTTTPGTQFFDLRKSGAFVFSPKDLQSREFQDAVSTDTVLTPDAWNSVMLLITGPASTAVVDVEWQYHYEGLIDATVGLSLGKQTPPKPTVVKALGMLGQGTNNIFGGSYERITAMIKAKATQAARYLVNKGFTYVANSIVPGSGAMLPQLTDVLEVD